MSLASHRPRGIGEIVDATFNLYRAHFSTVIMVALVVVAPPAIAKAFAPAGFDRLFDVIGNLVIPIGQGAIASIVAAAVERDEVLSSGDALRSTGGRTGSLIGVQIVSGLMVLLGLILLVLPGVIALAWTAVCIPVVMIEEAGYAKAISRSRALARGRLGHAFGTLLLSWGLVLLILFGAGLLMGLVHTGDRGSDLLASLLFAVVVPVPAIAMTLLYYDLRVRTESADLDAMISALPTSMPAD